MKLRLVRNKNTKNYTIERKDGWFGSWAPVYGTTKGYNAPNKPIVSEFDGGWFYKSKQFALESMENYMREFKIQEQKTDEEFKTIEMDSKDWA